MERRLILFGKRPLLGRVKTRLVPPLTADRALELYRAFLADQLRFLRAFAETARIEWCADGPADPAAIDPDAVGIAATEQGEGDMGDRLLRAIARSAREGDRATVVIGADSPTLPAAHVLRAFEMLQRGDAPAVIAPATDGGYVLIGMTAPLRELIAGVVWGGAEVAEATRRAARRAGILLAELDGWYDVDDGAALERLAREFRRDPGARARAPRTARLLDSGQFAVV